MEEKHIIHNQFTFEFEADDKARLDRLCAAIEKFADAISGIPRISVVAPCQTYDDLDDLVVGINDD